jgi:hypothetical protein
MFFVRKPADPTKNYQQLRQRQNAAWSLSSVEIGIEHAGRKEWDRAIKAYKHALEIDPDCVDAMVGKLEAEICIKNNVSLKHRFVYYTETIICC